MRRPAFLFGCLVLAGCGTGRGVPPTCPDNPVYYHIYVPLTAQPHKAGMTAVRHLRKEDWDRPPPAPTQP